MSHKLNNFIIEFSGRSKMLYLMSFCIVAGICNFFEADAIGGEEKKLGYTDTKEECAAMVINNEPTANGASFGIKLRKGECYAEFGATEQNFDSENWQSCLFSDTSKLLSVVIQPTLDDVVLTIYPILFCTYLHIFLKIF